MFRSYDGRNGCAQLEIVTPNGVSYQETCICLARRLMISFQEYICFLRISTSLNYRRSCILRSNQSLFSDPYSIFMGGKFVRVLRILVESYKASA